MANITNPLLSIKGLTGKFSAKHMRCVSTFNSKNYPQWCISAGLKPGERTGLKIKARTGLIGATSVRMFHGNSCLRDLLARDSSRLVANPIKKSSCTIHRKSIHTQSKGLGPTKSSCVSKTTRQFSISSNNKKPNAEDVRTSSGASAIHDTGPHKITVSQRISNAASFSFYSVLVLAGIGATGLAVYYFVSELLLPSSDVQIFNKAVGLIQNDLECQSLLGSSRIKAFGEESGNKWARSRPIASGRTFDTSGREHLYMRFHVEGELAEGLVRLEMVKDQNGVFVYRYLVLEVPGHSRVYIINNTQPVAPKESKGFLGVKWGKS